MPSVRVAEGADLKSVEPKGFAGSNPVGGVIKFQQSNYS